MSFEVVTIGNATLYRADCMDVLPMLPKVDACITDPPYGLSFMGKKWDYDVPSVEVWAECLRVLKPGGHLLAFAGTRTQHRMCVRIEDAGFEIRDMIAWVYGSGFPKSLDVSKAIDKAAGAEREVVGDKTFADGSKARKTQKLGGNATFSDEVSRESNLVLTAPATEAARQWQGWGTALKPALEPITVARKPLSEGTVAANVLAHGTGALNIDGCRVEDTVETWPATRSFRSGISSGYTEGIEKGATQSAGAAPTGRWPANLIHDGSGEVLGAFPSVKTGVCPAHASGTNSVYGDFAKRGDNRPAANGGDTGSAARFFYCAKASKKDRDDGLDHLPEMKSSVGDNRPGGDFNEGLGKTPGVRRNHHPTVKPIDLMRYLVRLVTPPGGMVLDPFMGSGSTGKAAMLDGFRFIGIERERKYFDIACKRIEDAQRMGDMFGFNGTTAADLAIQEALL
jgi:DNA modification methylase